VAGDVAAVFLRARVPIRVWNFAYGYCYDLLDVVDGLYNLDFIYFIQNAYKFTLLGQTLRLLEVCGVDTQVVHDLFAKGYEYAEYGIVYSAQEVAGAFKAVYGYSIEATAYLLKAMDYTVDEVVKVAKNIYGVVSEAAVKAFSETLKIAGYAAAAVESAIGAVWSFMKDVWNFIKFW
jgi:hypothetical protein